VDGLFRPGVKVEDLEKAIDDEIEASRWGPLGFASNSANI
jgi:hypothetical protein